MDEERPGLPAKVRAAAAWVQRRRLVRVMTWFGERRGAVLASGLAYQALFAVFAAIWVGFAIAGIVIGASPAIREAFLDLIDTSVPGLLDRGPGPGAVDPEVLFQARILGWTGAAAAVGLVWTALGWMDSARRSVRQMFEARPPGTPFLLLKLKDLGLALGFGVALLLSAALLVTSTDALEWVYALLGVRSDAFLAQALTRLAALTLMFCLDTAVLAVFYRVLSGLSIPVRRLMSGALLGAGALGAVKVLGTTLLGGASANPLLASFAVLLGMLIWFNVISQVILISAAWIAVGMADHGLVADPAVLEEQRQQERRMHELAEQHARALLPRWLRWVLRRSNAQRSEPPRSEPPRSEPQRSTPPSGDGGAA